jgi:hypothetical protein
MILNQPRKKCSRFLFSPEGRLKSHPSLTSLLQNNIFRETIFSLLQLVRKQENRDYRMESPFQQKQGLVKFKLPEFSLNKTIEFKVHVDETTVHDNAAYYMIIDRDLIIELKLVLDFDTQCVSCNVIDQPMKTQGGLQKVTAHYEDLYSALMAPVSTIFQDDYEETREPQHVHASNKCQTRILDANYKAADLKEVIKRISTIDDIEKKNHLKLLRKYKHLFDGTEGNFEKSDVKLNLKEDAKPYHAKAFTVPKNPHDTLKHEKNY